MPKYFLFLEDTSYSVLIIKKVVFSGLNNQKSINQFGGKDLRWGLSAVLSALKRAYDILYLLGTEEKTRFIKTFIATLVEKDHFEEKIPILAEETIFR